MADSIDEPENSPTSRSTKGCSSTTSPAQPVKDTPKEQVRQRIARALFHEYAHLRGGHGARLPSQGRRQEQEDRHRHLRRPAATTRWRTCAASWSARRSRPTARRAPIRLRDHDQAKKEFELLHGAMADGRALQVRPVDQRPGVLLLRQAPDPLRRQVRPHRRLAHGRRVDRHCARWPPLPACAGPTRRCCASPSAAATTSSTATRACPRTPPSGSSST